MAQVEQCFNDLKNREELIGLMINTAEKVTRDACTQFFAGT